MDARSFFLGMLFALLIGSLAGLALYYVAPQALWPAGEARCDQTASTTAAYGQSPPSSSADGLDGTPAAQPPFSLFGDCTQVEPVFSPGSSDTIRALIRSSRKSIEIEMYVFTDETLVQELADAQKRGVDVRIIIEARVESSSLDTIVAALRDGGVSVRWASTQFALTHAKTMIIDGKKVLVGSINFSKAAQNKNREAAAILEGKEVASYSAIFAKDWNDARMIKAG